MLIQRSGNPFRTLMVSIWWATSWRDATWRRKHDINMMILCCVLKANFIAGGGDALGRYIHYYGHSVKQRYRRLSSQITYLVTRAQYDIINVLTVWHNLNMHHYLPTTESARSFLMAGHKTRLTFLCYLRSSNIHIYIHSYTSRVVVKALCYKPEGRGFGARWAEFLNLPNRFGRTRPWGLLSL
jgi:hypothetical protein